MYTLKSIARRGSAFGMAAAVLAASVIPAAPAFADALNPLTDRSLTLSSGSPGWAFTDGSGNSTYAPPNSGANGKKTGNTFAFKVSSDSTANTIKTFTFQYCTTPAGNCVGPGDNGYSGGNAIANSTTTDAARTSDLDVVLSSPSQISQASLGSYVNTGTGNVTTVPAPAVAGSNFIVMYKAGGTWVSSDGWTMISENAQTGTQAASTNTGKNNQIKLTNTTGQGFTAGQEVKIVFFGTDSNYITNPGSDEFFVRINTYNSATAWNDTTLVDGGVTVANVMNESIQIITKVLETMDFSVGTVDPYTLEATGSAGSQLELAKPGQLVHGVCDPILTRMTANDPVNTLQLGNADGEFSLETDKTYTTHSYWRLSSNSSAGATVYYSGVTLSNTVNDKIDAIGPTKAAPIEGSEQFGLALANGSLADAILASDSTHAVNYSVERNPGDVFENGADNDTNGLHASVTGASPLSNLSANPSWHAPRLAPLVPHANYDQGAGIVNSEYGTPNTMFAFDETSNTIPVPMASQSTEVVDCVTGKVRYAANIAATTPAGIYTTKINYIAAPQY